MMISPGPTLPRKGQENKDVPEQAADDRLIQKKGILIEKKGYLIIPALIIVMIIGYLLCKNNDDSSIKSNEGKPYSSIDAVQGMPDIEKGRNPLPEVKKAKLQLESVDNIDRIKVMVEENKDDRRSINYNYEWFKNNEPFGTNADNITGFKGGDKIDVKITPFEGKRYGRTVMLNMEVARVPPKIVENRTIGFDGKVLSHQVKAVDPDGGMLTYSLTDPPEGVAMDSETGMITWQVKAGENNKCNLNVKIKNNSGAEAAYPLSIDANEVREVNR